ncbi:MAG: 16S rRNA (guanine(527)-N(7))-methyltransferase RsmG [Bacteroidetes bacterium]|nr:16S rRNA (guanine(527)-N(7))-methyltransferase RsmG [Bacteroidota bacterium]
MFSLSLVWELIRKYFPDLSSKQFSQFEQLYPLYEEWNNKINVISRKDFDQLYEKHVLHSLAVAKFIQFKPGSRVLDIGTGGGFPSLPLSIFFEDVEFVAVDSIAKKIKVVQEVSQAIGLVNINPVWSRVEDIKGSFDFIVSRAVAPLIDLYAWTNNKIAHTDFHEMKNGFICLKGADLDEEKKTFIEKNKRTQIVETPISNYFSEDFFEKKSILYAFKS